MPDLDINPRPTQFDELNDVLRELTERAAAILGEQFVGAYLQGSFAVGDADEASDVDFLVVVRDGVPPEAEEQLRAMHREFPLRPQRWAQTIEGSYPPADELRTLDAIGKLWLYIDNGHAEMTYSTHCNTDVVRWSLRECGITLAGPPPATLVDEVPADVLRATMRSLLPNVISDIESWISLDIGWAQRYAVATTCRVLYTLVTGRVASKKASMLWAVEALDPEWQPLITEAVAGRAAFWRTPTRPGAVDETRAFHAYAAAWGARK